MDIKLAELNIEKWKIKYKNMLNRVNSDNPYKFPNESEMNKFYNQTIKLFNNFDSYGSLYKDDVKSLYETWKSKSTEMLNRDVEELPVSDKENTPTYSWRDYPYYSLNPQTHASILQSVLKVAKDNLSYNIKNINEIDIIISNRTAILKYKVSDENPIKGGIGDDLDMSLISDDELESGIEVESEHSPDIAVQKDIVKDHEFEAIEMTGKPNYYKYLEEMENKMKEDGEVDDISN